MRWTQRDDSTIYHHLINSVIKYVFFLFLLTYLTEKYTIKNILTTKINIKIYNNIIRGAFIE